MHYVHKDYLGSWLCITNSSGAVVEERSFDAWGRRRNPSDWSFTGLPSSYKFSRGYTTHEHLDKFGLINMNGRMYDPVVGRFLSPDNFVQLPDFTQSYNRYAYCLNNPLVYTDPSGEGWETWLIGGIIGAVINVINNRDNIDNFWDFNKYAFVGMCAGSTAAFLAEMGVESPGIGMVSGFITGSGNALVTGGNFEDFMNGGATGFLNGGMAGFIIFGAQSILNINVKENAGRGYGERFTLKPEKTQIPLGQKLFGNLSTQQYNFMNSQITSTGSITLTSYYQNLLNKQSLDPIKEHLNESISMNDFIGNIQYCSFRDVEDLINHPGNPSGLRYVVNPFDNNVIDMRHMLFVGYRFGETIGKLIEFGQWVFRNPSGMNAQDFYSNRLGANFAFYYSIKLFLNPNKLSYCLNNFFSMPTKYNHKFRGSIWF